MHFTFRLLFVHVDNFVYLIKYRWIDLQKMLMLQTEILNNLLIYHVK